MPSRTGVSFTADTLYELSKHPNINGLKAASGNFSLLAETMAKCGDNLNVWSGNDDQIVPLMSLGGKGCYLGAVQRSTAGCTRHYSAVPRQPLSGGC